MAQVKEQSRVYYVMTERDCNPDPAFNALMKRDDGSWEIYLYESYDACNRAIKNMGYDNQIPHPVQFGEVDE